MNPCFQESGNYFIGADENKISLMVAIYFKSIGSKFRFDKFYIFGYLIKLILGFNILKSS